MTDKIKQILAAGLTFGALSIPGFDGWEAAAGGQGAVIAAVIAVYTVSHGLIEYAHGKVSPAPAVASHAKPGSKHPAGGNGHGKAS